MLELRKELNQAKLAPWQKADFSRFGWEISLASPRLGGALVSGVPSGMLREDLISSAISLSEVLHVYFNWWKNEMSITFTEFYPDDSFADQRL